jgi:predicted permease
VRAAGLWIRITSILVPGWDRPEWIEEWDAELTVHGGAMTHAWGALADAWYLRTEGWTMDAMWRDVRGAIKGLIRRPFFTALAGVTLAIGIGANTAIYSVVDGVLINPLPFPEADRILSYNHEAPGLNVNVPVIPHSPAMYLHYDEHARAIESFAVFADDAVNLITDGEPRQLTASLVTHKYFDVLGIQPFMGRGFAEGEDLVGAEPVAVIGHPLWASAFGSDPSVVGRLVEMDGIQRRVIGIMPEGFLLSDEDLWIPVQIDPESPEMGSLQYIGAARLADGATIETAQAEMQDLLLRFAEANPDEMGPEIVEQIGLAPDVKPLKDVFVQDVRQSLWVLLGTVGFVLLIACANVANLFLVRAESRQREQALRTAIGASRADVMRQYLAESVTLAVGSGLLGLGLAFFGVRALLAVAPADLPAILHIGIDGSVLLFTAIISLLAGIAFGILPGFGYGRGDLSNSLKDGSRSSTTGRERHRARSALVVAQVALALVLLVGSGLMLRSFMALRKVDLGFDPAQTMTFRFALPEAEYPEAVQVLEFQRRLTDELSGRPGIESVGIVAGIPLEGMKSAGPLEAIDQPLAEGDLGPIVERRTATPGYFGAMRISMLQGRDLTWEDQADQTRGVVVSETLARSFWPDGNALGRQVRSQGSEHSWEVVGVVADVRFDGVEEEPLPMIYYPVLEGTPESPRGDASRSMAVVLRVSGDPLAAIPTAREALRAADPRLPMINPRTVESVVEDSMAATSFTVLMLGIAAGIALLLGTVGIYGVISYIVSRRTQEIGVRMALGAPGEVVLRSVLKQGMALTGVGLVIGLLGAWGMSNALSSLLYGVATTDPVTFLGTAVFLGLVAILATWVPARRAARVDPVEALRSE